MSPADLLIHFGYDSTRTTPGCDHTIFSDVIALTRPRNILETGFFRGGSAAALLYLSGDATLTSVDPMQGTDNLLSNAPLLQSAFPDRFTLLQKSSADVRGDLAGQRFDLFNLDGDHSRGGVENDYQLALDLDIPWVLVDDFLGDVRWAYEDRYRAHFAPIRVYARDDRHNGHAIPRVLMKQRRHLVEGDAEVGLGEHHQ